MPRLTLLCIASYEKGYRFLEQAKREGCRVLLLTSQSLKDKAQWPKDSLDDIFYMPDADYEWNLDDMLKAVSYLARTEEIDRVIALDDFDLEKASLLREHLRLPGLGESATRYFRDKLAMRMRAQESGIRVPAFTGAIHNERIRHFLRTAPPPWVLKPRLMAGAMGIKKCMTADEAWEHINTLGDRQSFFLLEQFIPGDIFHVDSIWFNGQMVFSIASGYGTPPFEVANHGGIFTTQTLERGNELDRSLRQMNEEVLQAFGLANGVSHTEFIRAHEDGALYFLETSARVGGANIADLVEAATGVNLWSEWAKLEAASARNQPYTVPETTYETAGLIVSLARQEWPGTSLFNEPEVAWQMNKRHHVGVIVKSPQRQRVGELMGMYTERIRTEFHASAPPREKPGE